MARSNDCHQNTFDFILSLNCTPEQLYCCNAHCCLLNRQRREVWETWYFWLGIALVALFALTAALSYLASACRRTQHDLVRIRNVSTPVPLGSAVSGPGGLIQPRYPGKAKAKPAVSVLVANGDAPAELGPLDPAYPAAQPVVTVRGSAPPLGFRQTALYTELVLPPGYVDTSHKG